MVTNQLVKRVGYSVTVFSKEDLSVGQAGQAG
jgi:hypothetical protein